MIHRRSRLALLLLVLSAVLIGQAPPARAHAELVRADPPIDGLVLSSPGQLRLEFTEPIDANASLGLLGERGDTIGTSIAGVDDRRLIVNIPSLDPGTYTVTWSVTSSTDGHPLSGTYAFRVGGGLPPGAATVEGDRPATWAIAARWATFVGVAMVLGALLFRVIAPGSATAIWERRRAQLLLGGSVIALGASVIEPVLQSALASSTAQADIGDAVRGMPTAWWWRPAAGIPLLGLALAVAYPLRRRVSLPVAAAGTLLGVMMLFGLAGTSHAAGQERWREVAVANDAVHQISTALWVGGLLAIAAWGRGRDPATATMVTRRFSRIALPLVAIAVVTGVANSGFILPLLAMWRNYGWEGDAFRPILTGDYGVVLIIKIAVLCAGLGLAVVNRRAIGRSIPKLRRVLPVELAVVLIVVLGGSALALTVPPAQERPALDQITLVAPTALDGGEGPYLAHMVIDPARQGNNALTLTLSDWEGNVDPYQEPPTVDLTFTSLDHGVARTGVSLDATRDDRWRWSTSGLDLSIAGWWRITATIISPDAAPATAAFHVLLPDPNTSGFSRAPRPETDAEADALFRRANARFTDWTSVRWTEQLGSGNDVLLLTDSTVIDRGAPGPSAYRSSLTYAGAFDENADPPRRDGRTSVTVGDRAWMTTDNGQTWLEQPPTRFDVPAEWSETYAGATNIRMGATGEIDGRRMQIVTFYSPDQPRQSEAWFAWWIDVETGDVRQVAMIANRHYMVWNYHDINAPLVIDPPV